MARKKTKNGRKKAHKSTRRTHVKGGFKRKRRQLSYTRRNLNELLALAAARMPDDNGCLPPLTDVLDKYHCSHPNISIPYSTFAKLVKEGCDGKENEAPQLGRPTRIPTHVEAELAKQVIQRLY